MARNVEIEVSRSLKHLYSPLSQRYRSRLLIQALEHWGEFSTSQQRIYAPRGETGRLHGAIHTSLPRQYLPGGLGGGGGFQVSSGVRRGIAPHAEHVLFGTAYGDRIPLGGNAMTPGRIYPKSARFAHLFGPQGESLYSGMTLGMRMPALKIQKKGEPVKFRAWVSGQRPNNFVYTAYIDTAVYARGQLRSLARGMLRPRTF